MVIIVYGVSGCGKTTVGSLLAGQLGWEFIDADDFHPPANIAKMSSGIPLDDDDRQGWLLVLRAEIAVRIAAGRSAVLACSALRQAYRETLTVSPDVRFVRLQSSFEVISGRLEERRGHFMSASLLRSQFDTLEPPREGEVVADGGEAPEDVCRAIRDALGLGN